MVGNIAIKKIAPYKPGKPIEEVKRELGLKRVIKLASNENPLGPSPKAIASLRRALSVINRYPVGSCFRLRRALSRKLKVKPQNLLFGNGSDEIVDIIIKAFCGPKDEVLTADKTFLEYKIIAQQNAKRVKAVALNGLTYDLRAIKKAINSKTKVIFIANPNNPTGTYCNKLQVEDFMQGLPRDIVVVFDEAYYEFVEEADFPRTFEYFRKGRNVIILRTFSKIYGLAGLRIGYAIANERLIGYMERARQPFNVNSLAQAGAEAALGDEGFLRKTLSLNASGKKYLYKEFRALGIRYIPSAANFILFDAKGSGEALSKELLFKGIIVRDMKQYGLERFLRVTIGTDKENRMFIRALREVRGK